MVKQAIIVATFLSAAVVIGFVSYGSYQQKRQYHSLQEELEKIKAAADHRAQELTNSQARIEALIREKEEVARGQQQMETQMREALKTRDVTISELQGKLTVNILDRVLFDSGEAEIKPEGEGVLRQIADVLSQYPDRQIYVIGHTDNVPIRSTIFSRYPSNWELSTARATAAVRFLTEKAGVDAMRFAAVGYGEYHPVSDNSTPEGRAKNRRIAIVVMPEKFNPLEMLSSAGSTNLPPSQTSSTNTPPDQKSGTTSAPSSEAKSDANTNAPAGVNSTNDVKTNAVPAEAPKP